MRVFTGHIVRLGRSIVAAGLLFRFIPVTSAQDNLSATAHTASSSTSGPAPSSTAPAGTYAFTHDGVMTGQPPTRVVLGQPVTFTVVRSKDVEASQVLEVADRLTGAVEGINVVKEKRLLPTFLLLGIDSARLDEIRSTYCERARELLHTIGNSSARDRILERLSEACPAANVPKVPNILPLFKVGAVSYTLDVACRDVGRSPSPLTNSSVSGGVIEFMDQAPGCNERSFALRLVKPVPGAIDKWLQDNPLPKDIRPALEKARKDYADKKDDLHKLVKDHKDVRDCLKKAALDVQAIIKCAEKPNSFEAFATLKKISGTLEDANVVLRDLFNPLLKPSLPAWVEKWLWMSAGRPTLHPLAATDVSADENELKEQKAELAALDAELAVLDKFIAGGLKIEDPAKFKEVVQTFSETKKKREKANTRVAELTKKISTAESGRLKDSLLYDGTYLISREQPAVVMQHHDTLNQYVIMGKPITEISEKLERVAILVENAEVATQLKIVQTITPITADTTQFLDDLALTDGTSDAPDPAEFQTASPANRTDMLRQVAADVITQYDLLVLGVEFSDQQLTEPPALIRFVLDDTPARVTKIVPHDLPSPAPSTVAYTIKKLEGTEEKVVGSASYRLNRLYRVRFRTGVLFSTLETTKVEDNNEVVRKHGVDMLFGVATFFRRRDPRTIEPSNPAWSLLTALTIRNPTENLLVGIGYEPWGGVTFNLGGHLGRSERKSTTPGEPVVEDEWNARPFFGVSFDVDFLKQLFSIKPQV